MVQWPGDVKNKWQSFDRHFNIIDTVIGLSSSFGECKIGANFIPKRTDRLSYFRRGEEFKNLRKARSKSEPHVESRGGNRHRCFDRHIRRIDIERRWNCKEKRAIYLFAYNARRLISRFDSALNYHGGRLRNTATAIRARSFAAVFPFCTESRYLDADTCIRRGPCTFVTVIHLPWKLRMRAHLRCTPSRSAFRIKRVIYITTVLDSTLPRYNGVIGQMTRLFHHSSVIKEDINATESRIKTQIKH